MSDMKPTLFFVAGAATALVCVAVALFGTPERADPDPEAAFIAGARDLAGRYDARPADAGACRPHRLWGLG